MVREFIIFIFTNIPKFHFSVFTKTNEKQEHSMSIIKALAYYLSNTFSLH